MAEIFSNPFQNVVSDFTNRSDLEHLISVKPEQYFSLQNVSEPHWPHSLKQVTNTKDMNCLLTVKIKKEKVNKCLQEIEVEQHSF